MRKKFDTTTMTLDECEGIFDRALASASGEEFRHVIEPLFNEYEVLSLQFGRGSIFWRARLIEGVPYGNISELDYPHPEHVKQGRLNDHGCPAFYISARKETALAEVGAEEGWLVQIAGFRVLSESPIRLAVIGEYSNVQKSGYMHFAGRDPDMAIARILNSMSRQEALKRIYIDKFFASVLSDVNASDNNYMFSRALGQAIYARNDSEGIVFPSVRDRGGFNVGVKPDPSDKCFHNVSCLVVQMGKKRRFGLAEFKIIKSAARLDDDGGFIWMDNDTPEIIGIYNMSKDEYVVAASDPNDRNALLNMLHTGRC